MSTRRNRGLDFGVLLLGYELIRSNNIPPVTLSAILAQIAIYLEFIPQLGFNQIRNICILPAKVLHLKEWQRLIFSTFVHGDDMHLYYNMISFLWKGRRLESRFGSGYFAYLLFMFAILTNLVIVVLSLALGGDFMNQCAIGFSGVLFALKVLTNHYFPHEDSWLFGWVPVPSVYASWLELIVIQILVPNASFVGHLAGILVGIAYTKGPLKLMMDFVYQALTGLQLHNEQQPPRRRNTNSNERRGNFERYTGGLSEEEQLRRAMDESRQQFYFGNGDYSRNRQQPTAPPYERMYPDAT